MPNPFTRALTWLRAGYPQGVPTTDYVALYGLLHRSLTDPEIEELAVQLSRGSEGVGSDVSDEQIREALRRHAHQEPTKEDVMRVLERLEAANWPTGEIPAVTDEAPQA